MCYYWIYIFLFLNPLLAHRPLWQRYSKTVVQPVSPLVWVAGEGQGDAVDHSGLQGCVRRSGHLCNRGPDSAQSLGGNGGSGYHSLPAQ